MSNPSIKKRIARFRRKYISPLPRVCKHENSPNHVKVDNEIEMYERAFDSDYYIQNYNDIALSGLDPFEHYMNEGWQEGKNPNTWFDVSEYLRTHPDVDELGIEPLRHYISFGIKEGRKLNQTDNSIGLNAEYIEIEATRIYAPIISYFLKNLSLHIKKHNIKRVFFLSREGFFLQRLYEKGIDAKLFEATETKYLEVSRAYLFRLLLLEGKDISLALDLRYKGTISSLLKKRFCLTESEIRRYFEKSSELGKRISLPNDARLTKKILSEVTIDSPSDYAVYQNYLTHNNFLDEKPLVVDIGYAGTIQKSLYMLTEKTVDGFYLIAKSAALNDRNFMKFNRIDACFMGVGNTQAGQKILEQALVLEGLLTSNQGQLMGVRKSHNGYYFIRGQKVRSQHYFHILKAIIDAVESFITDEKIMLYDSVNIEKHLEQLYYCETLIDSPLFGFLELDDSITGYGRINPNINR